MSDPTPDMARRAKLPPDELTLRRPVQATYALGKLIERSLRGMFDGPTTVRIDWDGPGLVLDLSAVFQDREALSLVLLAATAWLQAVLARPSVRTGCKCSTRRGHCSAMNVLPNTSSRAGSCHARTASRTWQ